MATHSRIPAWEISWTEEPGGHGHGQKSPWGPKESDTAEQLNTHTHITKLLRIFTTYGKFTYASIQHILYMPL